MFCLIPSHCQQQSLHLATPLILGFGHAKKPTHFGLFPLLSSSFIILQLFARGQNFASVFVLIRPVGGRSWPPQKIRSSSQLIFVMHKNCGCHRLFLIITADTPWRMPPSTILIYLGAVLTLLSQVVSCLSTQHTKHDGETIRTLK